MLANSNLLWSLYVLIGKAEENGKKGFRLRAWVEDERQTRFQKCSSSESALRQPLRTAKTRTSTIAPALV